MKGIKLLNKIRGDGNMSNEEKILYYRQKTVEELEEIIRDESLDESDIVIASVELGNKNFELGNVHTFEEVFG